MQALTPTDQTPPSRHPAPLPTAASRISRNAPYAAEARVPGTELLCIDIQTQTTDRHFAGEPGQAIGAAWATDGRAHSRRSDASPGRSTWPSALRRTGCSAWWSIAGVRRVWWDAADDQIQCAAHPSSTLATHHRALRPLPGRRGHPVHLNMPTRGRREGLRCCGLFRISRRIRPTTA